MKKFGVLLILVILAIPFVGTVQADVPGDPNDNSDPNSNLLVNPSFEQPGPLPGEPSGTPYYQAGMPTQYTGATRWFRWAGPSSPGGTPTADANRITNDAANAHSGTSYIKMRHNGSAGSPPGSGWLGMSQVVWDQNDSNDIHPGNCNYTQSIYARSAVSPTARFRFKLEFYRSASDWPPTWFAVYSSPIYNLVNNSWKRCQCTFACPAGTQKFHASYYIGDGITEEETIYLDDANLQESVPIPISPCDSARGKAEIAYGHWDPLPGDLNEDCYVNITDLCLGVQDWLKDCYIGQTCRGQ